MTVHRRAALVSLAALALAAAATLSAAGGSQSKGAARATHRPAAVVVGAEEPPPAKQASGDPASRAAREDRHRRSGSGHAGARAAALRFTPALLRFGVQPRERRIRVAVRDSATPALARRILGDEPHVPPGQRPPVMGRVVGLERLPAESGATEFAVTVRRGDAETGLVVTAVRRGARWVISDLR